VKEGEACSLAARDGCADVLTWIQQLDMMYRRASRRSFHALCCGDQSFLLNAPLTTSIEDYFYDRDDHFYSADPRYSFSSVSEHIPLRHLPMQTSYGPTRVLS